MTAKDFRLIAATLRDQRRYITGPTALDREMQWALLTEAFADRLAETNPRFKRDAFLRACGVEYAPR